MRYDFPSRPSQPHPLTLAAGTWLASGCVLLGLTPLPLHSATWGWSPVFWLLLAPALLLCVQYLLARPVRAKRGRDMPRTSRASGSHAHRSPTRPSMAARAGLCRAPTPRRRHAG